jgi:predicted glutamine amidotransferase
MCNLGGVFSFEKKDLEGRKEMLGMAKKILLENAQGNKDATGISLIDSFNDRVITIKKGIDAEDFLKKIEKKEKYLLEHDFNIILLHNRYATNGSKDNNVNNHPFITDNSVMIHNGVIGNYLQLAEIHALDRTGSCDSEVIQLVYDKLSNFKVMLKELYGSFNIALYDRKKKQLFLYRDSRMGIIYVPKKKTYCFSTDSNSLKALFEIKRSEDSGLFGEWSEGFLQEIDADNNQLYKIYFDGKIGKIKREELDIDCVYQDEIDTLKKKEWKNSGYSSSTSSFSKHYSFDYGSGYKDYSDYGSRTEKELGQGGEGKLYDYSNDKKLEDMTEKEIAVEMALRQNRRESMTDAEIEKEALEEENEIEREIQAWRGEGLGGSLRESREDCGRSGSLNDWYY